MTKKECAIVMAYTGITMLSGEDFNIYHKYIEDIMGRPVWTHELANESVVEEIKEKSKYDFLKLCEKAKYNDLTPMQQEPKTEWIPVTKKLPEEGEDVLVWYEYFRYGDYNCMWQTYGIGWQYDGHFSVDNGGGKQRVIAWQPLPKPYQSEVEK